MDVIIYHNPDCGTSRNTLAMIRQSGVEPDIIEYLKNPPSRERLIELIAAMGISVRALLRQKGTPYAELGLGELVELPVDEPGHVYHMYCVRSPDRDRLAAALAEADIGHAVYYLPPLHLQPALRYLGYSEGDFPETERASRGCRAERVRIGLRDRDAIRAAQHLRGAHEPVPGHRRFDCGSGVRAGTARPWARRRRRNLHQSA